MRRRGAVPQIIILCADHSCAAHRVTVRVRPGSLLSILALFFYCDGANQVYLFLHVRSLPLSNFWRLILFLTLSFRGLRNLHFCNVKGYWKQGSTKGQMIFSSFIMNGGIISGEGEDEIAKFTLSGTYAGIDAKFLKCYVGKHNVDYHGTIHQHKKEYRIKGEWNIGSSQSGEFKLELDPKAVTSNPAMKSLFSDPVVVVYDSDGVEIGRTEWIQDDLNPIFETPVYLCYTGQEELLTIKVFDVDEFCRDDSTKVLVT